MGIRELKLLVRVRISITGIRGTNIKWNTWRKIDIIFWKHYLIHNFFRLLIWAFFSFSAGAFKAIL